VVVQRSAQQKAFAAFVGEFFIPFPGTKISGEYTGRSSGGERGESRRFSSTVKILVLTPNPVRAPVRTASGARGTGPRASGVRRCGERRFSGGSGRGGGYTSCGKKVRRARRSRKNMVHPVVAAQRP